MGSKKKIGVIGYGRMGAKYVHYLQSFCPDWEVAYICDVNPDALAYAKTQSPDSNIVSDEDIIFQDESVAAVALCTLANVRHEQILKATKYHKHIISEKPIGDTLQREWDSVNVVENSDCLATVNLYLRNSWYHHLMKKYIDEGELGELAIIRICHMTPGLAPGEGHEYEGPAFHDCGMHYVGLARFFARCDFKTWHAQALRMWSWKDPWWLQCHGTMESGVVFDITQGFVYGQLSKDQTHNSYVELIGTQGFCRMTHDFKTAVVELHGVTRTERIERPHGGKNIDVLIDEMAQSILSGERHPNMPLFSCAATASDFAWRMLDDARQHDLPAIGNLDELERIRERRRNMTDGYGLLPRNNKNV